MKQCMKCKDSCKITESYPVWSLLNIKEPEYLCYKCKPEKLGVKFAQQTDYEFIKRQEMHEEN